MPYQGSPRTSSSPASCSSSTTSLPPTNERAGADLLLSLADAAQQRNVPQHTHTYADTTTTPSANSVTTSVTATTISAGNTSKDGDSTTNSASPSTASAAAPTITTIAPSAASAAATSVQSATATANAPPVTPSPLIHLLPQHAHLQPQPEALQPPPQQQQLAASAAHNMQMSLHGAGTHRLVPSPIKLPKSEQHNQQKRRQSFDEVELSHKKAKRDNDGEDETTAESPYRTSPTALDTSSSSNHNTVISPASSNEGVPKSPEHHQTHAAAAATAASAAASASNAYHPRYPPHYPPNQHPAAWMQPYYHPPHPGYPPHPFYVVHPYGPPPPQPQQAPPPAASSPASTPSPAPLHKQAPPRASPPALAKEQQPGQNTKAEHQVEEWQKTRAVVGHKARCVPMEHPTKARKTSCNGNACAEYKLPDFALLVNYPEHLTRGQTRGTEPSSRGLAPAGQRHCVMCGRLRICSSSSNRLNRSTAPAASAASASPQADSTVHIIPRQNKGVCTACDVTVWTICATQQEIKWCKGCKNFRPWAAFGDKGLATKCARCRERQREKYALQKRQAHGAAAAPTDEQHLLAAQGLSNLMRAQNA